MPHADVIKVTSRDLWLRTAAIASCGAGLIHATAAASHAEHPGVMWVFALVAVFQTGWGALVTGAGPAFRTAGVAGHLALVGGWLLAATSGIPPLPGLASPQGLGIADTLAALLAATAVASALHSAHPGAVLSPARTRTLVLTTTAALALAATFGITSATARHHPDGLTRLQVVSHTH